MHEVAIMGVNVVVMLVSLALFRFGLSDSPPVPSVNKTFHMTGEVENHLPLETRFGTCKHFRLATRRPSVKLARSLHAR